MSHLDGEALLSGGKGGSIMPISPSVAEGQKLLLMHFGKVKFLDYRELFL